MDDDEKRPLHVDQAEEKSRRDILKGHLYFKFIREVLLTLLFGFQESYCEFKAMKPLSTFVCKSVSTIPEFLKNNESKVGGI